MIDTSADATSLSPWWRHSAILVMIAGFSVLSFVTVLTYTNAPPIPEQAADVTGTVVFTGADIQMGQEVFLKYGLMEHGTLWGHGAYLGPDYSAEYLHRLSEVTRDTIATEQYGKLFAQLSPDERSVASARTMMVLKENRYEPASRTLRLSSGEVAAFRTELREWSDYFTRKDAAPGLPANYYSQPRGAKGSDHLLRLGGLGDNGESPWEGLLIHQQLALRAHRGKPSFHRGVCLERLESHHPPVRAGLDSLRRRQVRLLGLEGRRRWLPCYALCSPCFEAHAQPVGYGMVLRRRGPSVSGAIIPGRHTRPLSGGDRSLLRARHRPLAALQPGAYLAPPTRHLLDRDGLGGWRPFPGVVGRWRRAQTPEDRRLRTPRGAGGGRRRQPGRRVPRHQRQAGAALVLVRSPRFRVFGPRAALAVSAGSWAALLAISDVSGAQARLQDP